MELKNRKVSRFRAQIDPSIGPTPKNAFDKKSMGFEAELTPAGVYICMTHKVPGQPDTKTEHVVPFANVLSITLEPQEPTKEKLSS